MARFARGAMGCPGMKAAWTRRDGAERPFLVFAGSCKVSHEGRWKGQIVNRVNRELEGCHAIATHGSPMTPQRSQLDLLVCVLGRLLVIELKKPGKGPTPQQEYQMRLWSKSGAEVRICYSPAEAFQVVKEFRAKLRNPLHQLFHRGDAMVD